jgi:hypothetical protein
MSEDQEVHQNLMKEDKYESDLGQEIKNVLETRGLKLLDKLRIGRYRKFLLQDDMVLKGEIKSIEEGEVQIETLNNMEVKFSLSNILDIE